MRKTKIETDLIIEKKEIKFSKEEAIKKIQELENKISDLRDEVLIANVKSKAFAEVAFQYGKQLNKTVGETKFLEMVKELSVIKAKHNPIHETNIDFSPNNEEIITNYLSNKKYEFQNEFLPLFLSGKITMIGDREYMYWFEAIDDWLSLAKKGNKDAQKNLVVCFTNGYGVDKNSKMVEYWNDILEDKKVAEPIFEEFFEIVDENKEKPLNSEVAPAFNVDPNNLEKNIVFTDTQEYVLLKKKIAELYEQCSKIPTIYIKTNPSVEQILELSKSYEGIEYELKNDLFGSILAMHHSQFDFTVQNIKDYGSFLKRDKKADTVLKIANNSEWSCNLVISVKDQLGHVFNSRCKINPFSNTILNLFNQHPVGSKIETVIFKTIESSSKTFIYHPKNWIV